MEEKKNIQEKNQKLSYEKLSQMASDLYQQNQQLINRIQQMQDALEDASFNKLSFFVSMLFKVVEHPESYKNDFVVWCIETIESALTGFAENFNGTAGAESENKDGANEA